MTASLRLKASMLRAARVADVEVVAVLRPVQVVLLGVVRVEAVLALERRAAVLPVAVLRVVALRVAVLRVVLPVPVSVVVAALLAAALRVVEAVAPVVPEVDRGPLKWIWRNLQQRSMLRPVSTWRLMARFSELPRRLAHLLRHSSPGPERWLSLLGSLLPMAFSMSEIRRRSFVTSTQTAT
jgi:hypothetical protein